MTTLGKVSLYPDCWSDDTRMNVLFAPFRPKSVNPENYVSKLIFWKNMIKRYCELKGCAQFCRSELLLNFQRNEKSPYHALDHVLDDMLQQQEIKNSINFNETIEDGWSMWALKTFVKKPIIWGLRKTVGIELENQNVEYIYIDVVQRQSSDFLTALRQLNKKIVQCDDLNSLKDVNLNDEGMILCLRYLHSLKKLHVEFRIQENGEKQINVIKVPDVGQIASPLTDLEWTRLNLENTQKMLDKYIEDLHIELKNSENQARVYIREGKKSLAKASLRKKHIVEKNLEKRIIARDNIHVLLTNLQDAQDNGVVLNAIKMGSDTLKYLLKKSDLDLDNVDEILSEVKETLDTNEEVHRTLAEPVVDYVINDSDLEQELNEILSTSVDEKDEEIMFEKPKTENKEKTKKTKEESVEEKVKLNESDKELLEQIQNLSVENLSPIKDGATTPVP